MLLRVSISTKEGFYLLIHGAESVVYESTRDFHLERWKGGMDRVLFWSLGETRIELLCISVRYYSLGSRFKGLRIVDLGLYVDNPTAVPWDIAYAEQLRIYRISSAEGRGLLVGGSWGIKEGHLSSSEPSEFDLME